MRSVTRCRNKQLPNFSKSALKEAKAVILSLKKAFFKSLKKVIKIGLFLRNLVAKNFQNLLPYLVTLFKPRFIEQQK